MPNSDLVGKTIDVLGVKYLIASTAMGMPQYVVLEPTLDGTGHTMIRPAAIVRRHLELTS